MDQTRTTNRARRLQMKDIPYLMATKARKTKEKLGC